jgi:hypothetical protein
MFRKPKTAYFLSYVEYKPNANVSNFMKNRSCYRKVTYKREKVKKEVKKVNKVDTFPIQE